MRLDQIVNRGEALLPDDEVVDIARGLAAAPSFTGEETTLAEHVRGFLRRHGVGVELQEVDAGPDAGRRPGWGRRAGRLSFSTAISTWIRSVGTGRVIRSPASGAETSSTAPGCTT